MSSNACQESLPEGVRRVCNRHGREFIEIEHPRVTARISVEGAHIVSCVPTGQGPLLWLSPPEPELPGTPLRGGIPLCWPWFGNARSGPAHGVARTSLWLLNEASVSERGVRICLELPLAEMTDQLPDEQWKVQVRFDLGSELEVVLTTTNIGEAAQTLGQALHTYLPVSDINQAIIGGLDAIDYYDQLTGRTETQNGPVRFAGEVDRIYHGSIGPVQLIDAEERITVWGSGSRSAVIWNPWKEKSRRLGHFPPEGYQEMVCIETANAGPDTRVLEPGQTHSLSARITRLGQHSSHQAG